MAGGLVPGQRFRGDYYAGIRYVLDPVTGRVVQEGQPVGAPSTPITSMGAADITTVGLAPPSQASDSAGGLDYRPGGGGDDRGSDRGFGGPGSTDRGFDDLPKGDIDDIGGYSTIGTGAGLATGIGGLGLIGSGIDTVRDYNKAKDFDPEYESGLGSWASSLLNELTGGLLGKSQRDRARDNYRDRTGTGLNNAALDAAGKGGGYSGPKGVNKRNEKMKEVRDRGGDRGGGGHRGGARDNDRSTDGRDHQGWR